jgi:hypothetical protein
MISDREFAAFLLGDAPPDLRTRVEAALAVDDGLAAEVAALAPLGKLARVSPTVRSRWGGRPFSRRAVLASLVLATLGGTVWAGYEALRTPPLLADDFGSGAVNFGNWERHLGRKGVSATDGYLRLINRGSVVSRREFDGPIQIEFDWRWIDLAEWPLYSEIFSVGLRTHGEHLAQGDLMLTDGLVVWFDTVDHSIRIGPARRNYLKTTEPDSVPMPAGQWHHIRIVDDGTAVSVFIEGPAVDKRYKREPVLTVPVPEGLTGRRIAFLNREPVANMSHESHVDNIVVTMAK